MKEAPFPFRFVEVRGVRYLRLDDVAAFLRELGGSEETDVRGAGPGRIKHVDALLHVVSVFKDKDGERSIVTAEWFPTKRRWNYEVFWWYQAALGTIWPDGTEKPQCP